MVVRVIGIEGNRVTIEANPADFEGKETVDITINREKRSKNANAYFHVLVGKIADKLRISKAQCKNLMLARYGQYEEEDGKRLIISVDSSVDLSHREDIHTNPIGYGEINGRKFTHYAIMKSSHELDTRSFAILLDGTISEAKDLGIDVLPQEEIERLKSLWNPS